MRYTSYSGTERRKKRKKSIVIVPLLLLILGAAGLKVFGPTASERAVSRLQFDSSVTANEQARISQAISDQAKTLGGDTNVKVLTATEQTTPARVLTAHVPVTSFNSVRQKVTKAELASEPIVVKDLEDAAKPALAEALGTTAEQLKTLDVPLAELPDESIALIPPGDLDQSVKLLALEDAYYLDSFQSGGVFRTAVFEGEDTAGIDGLSLNSLPSKEQVFKVNMSGVTALTRLMLRALNANNNPTFFSEKIGPFLADADLTHVSNEVSFKENCTYHDALFCSDPRFIETLKASGVDLVELTGNHNNDLGAVHNTATINLYRELGWNTIGGGLNTEDAKKPYIADQKGSKVGFLAYNFPDSPNGGAIAGPEKAGANSFDFDRIKSDIESLKTQSQFVIVNIQFWECYAYPNGYVEYPICDKPIQNQAETFKRVVDLGADMVVGSSAHQPQTYEIYKGKPIYYGLGNMYFEQTQWPGTERGIILTHYFSAGKLLQTKLTPTVYGDDFQPRVMTDEEATYQLKRLNAAR